ncbi:MAG: hypothetical protein ACYCXT_11495 [Acidiferrobacteraceae bacterium]
MRLFPAHIPTKSLKLSDVPNESAPWTTIGGFALTFNPAEDDPYHLKGQDLAALSADSSLVQLRSHLFLEQRRWDHFGREPDVAAMSAIRRVLALIRAKLSEQSKGAAETGA